ncbi:ABC transporter ATP-binding protein [Planococcus sp. ISL-109]|nr:ABC transporter ATP-binding protein [Planococcus sp. ISL-109]
MPVCNQVFVLEDFSFCYPDTADATLNHLDVAIEEGQRVVITGPSGCGKSSLLYLLNRLYPANCDGTVSGTLDIYGKRSGYYAPGEINQTVATVFQDPDAQFCMPTVEEELAFTLENLHTPHEDMQARIDDILLMTGLEAHRHRVIQTLSGGWKQRVATACALIMEPKCLLLDEPLTHLDPLTAMEFVSWLDALQSQRKLTIIAVEHKLELWGSFFDREIALNADGCIDKDRAFAATLPIPFKKRQHTKRHDTLLTAEQLMIEKSGKQLISAVSLSLAAGQVAVVAGPNGCGKSTLLKALCGIYRPPNGTVRGDPAGYVPQSPEQLFLTKNVTDELAFSGKSSPAEMDRLMNGLFLQPIAHAHPFSISHGQKRRVAIGAMLADKRKVLLLDEPTAGQDEQALKELYELIDARAKDGCTAVIVTHDMNFAASIADSILLMKDGTLTGVFDPDALWGNDELLHEHRLLAPKGRNAYATDFA